MKEEELLSTHLVFVYPSRLMALRPPGVWFIGPARCHLLTYENIISGFTTLGPAAQCCYCLDLCFPTLRLGGRFTGIGFEYPCYDFA